MPKSIAAFCIAVLLSACGQTGALYLPDKGKPPDKHKNKPAKVVPVTPPPAAPAATKPDTAPDADRGTPPDPNPDDATQAAPSP